MSKSGDGCLQAVNVHNVEISQVLEQPLTLFAEIFSVAAKLVVVED